MIFDRHDRRRLANLFGADTPALLGLGRAIDSTDIGALWVTDHFSGAVADKPFSRDPFVALGALAAATERVDLGLLVANINNRHPVQLASAINSLQSLAPGRIRLGMGSGAVSGSRFAVEHDAIGTVAMATELRRQHLRDQIRAVRAIWRGDSSFSSPTLRFAGLTAVVDGIRRRDRRRRVRLGRRSRSPWKRPTGREHPPGTVGSRLRPTRPRSSLRRRSRSVSSRSNRRSNSERIRRAGGRRGRPC